MKKKYLLYVAATHGRTHTHAHPNRQSHLQKLVYIECTTVYSTYIAYGSRSDANNTHSHFKRTKEKKESYTLEREKIGRKNKNNKNTFICNTDEKSVPCTVTHTYTHIHSRTREKKNKRETKIHDWRIASNRQVKCNKHTQIQIRK